MLDIGPVNLDAAADSLDVMRNVRGTMFRRAMGFITSCTLITGCTALATFVAELRTSTCLDEL